MARDLLIYNDVCFFLRVKELKKCDTRLWNMKN